MFTWKQIDWFLKNFVKEAETYTDSFKEMEIDMTYESSLELFVELMSIVVPDDWIRSKDRPYKHAKVEKFLKIWRTFIVDFDLRKIEHKSYLRKLFKFENLKNETKEAILLFPVFPEDQEFMSNLVKCLFDRIKDLTWHFEQSKESQEMPDSEIDEKMNKKKTFNSIAPHNADYFSFELKDKNNEIQRIEQIGKIDGKTHYNYSTPEARDDHSKNSRNKSRFPRTVLFQSGSVKNSKQSSFTNFMEFKSEHEMEIKIRLNLLMRKSQHRWYNLARQAICFLQKQITFNQLKKRRIEKSRTIPVKGDLNDNCRKTRVCKMGVTFGESEVVNDENEGNNCNTVSSLISNPSKETSWSDALKSCKSTNQVIVARNSIIKRTNTPIKNRAQGDVERFSLSKSPKRVSFKEVEHSINLQHSVENRLANNWKTPPKSTVHEKSTCKKLKYEKIFTSNAKREPFQVGLRNHSRSKSRDLVNSRSRSNSVVSIKSKPSFKKIVIDKRQFYI